MYLKNKGNDDSRERGFPVLFSRGLAMVLFSHSIGTEDFSIVRHNGEIGLLIDNRHETVFVRLNDRQYDRACELFNPPSNDREAYHRFINELRCPIPLDIPVVPFDNGGAPDWLAYSE